MPRCCLLSLFLCLDAVPERLDFGGREIARIAEDMRVAADHLGGDGLDHVGKGESAFLLRHLRVVDHLQQQIAELVLEVELVAACDRVGNLIGLLDRIGRDRGEVLLQIPGAARTGRAERRHDLDQAGDVAGRLQRCKSP